jgi:glycerophosphoryl diester phosphodiesterase
VEYTEPYKANNIIVGHRGAAGHAPENTMASFRKAIEFGVDVVELDVHLTNDGVVVVHHDNSLDRTTSGKGEIKSHKWDHISKLDAGTSFSHYFKNETVPSLEDVIKLCKGKTEVLIEIKDGEDVYPEIEDRIIELIRKYKAEKWCIVQSFRDDVIFRIHRIAPDIRLQKLFVRKLCCLPVIFDSGASFFSFQKYHFVESFNILYKYAGKQFIEQVHKHNKKVMVWTVNEAEDIAKMKAIGVDGIISDFPDRCF